MKFYGLAAALFFCLAANAQDRGAPYLPQMRDAKVEVYKTIGDTKLSLYIFNPPGHTAALRRPAIVFFFGGGWRQGSPDQFEAQCRELASLGMVAISADYRVFSRNQSNVLDSVRDAKSAIRYIRENAQRFGIDPQRIAAGGGSSGVTSRPQAELSRAWTNRRRTPLSVRALMPLCSSILWFAWEPPRS